MTSSSSMRALLDTIDPNSDSRVDQFLAQACALKETRQSLYEGAIGDRINAVTKRVHDQYGDIQYAFLAKATMKAMNAYQGKDPKVASTLARIAKVGKFAIQNRALLSVLLGLVSTLVGIAAHPSPAGAGAVNQIDMLLQGKGLDEILDKLHQSGIEVGAVSDVLPPGVSEVAAKAAKALVAIERYKFVQGGDLQSSRELTDSVSMTGTITKTGSTLHELIDLKTSDGKVSIARIDTTYTNVNGQYQEDPSETGVQFQLDQYVRGKSLADTNAAQDYLEKALNHEHSVEHVASGMQEAQAGILQRIRTMVTGKSKDLGMLAALALADKPDGTYTVSIGPDGVKVTPREQPAAPATSPQ